MSAHKIIQLVNINCKYLEKGKLCIKTCKIYASHLVIKGVKEKLIRNRKYFEGSNYENITNPHLCKEGKPVLGDKVIQKNL